MPQTINSTFSWVRKQLYPTDRQDKYTELSGDDSIDPVAHVSPDPKPGHRNMRPWIVGALVTLGFIILTFVSFITGRPPSGHVESYLCGNSATEAEARGCVFDTMLYGWIHTECFDEELMEQYLHAGNWTWQDDPQHEAPLPDVSVVGVGHKELSGRGLWATQPDSSGRWVHRWEFHLVHCAYSWELMERAYNRPNGWVVRELDYEEGVEHAGHCGERIAAAARQGLDEEAKEFVQTKSKNGTPLYFTCAKPEHH